jgi:hypothetical protein
MTISQSPSKPETLQSMNRNSNQTQPQGPMELFAVMKDGSIFEMAQEDVRLLLGDDALPVAYRLVHLNGDTFDFRQANLDLVRDDLRAAKALHLSNLNLARDDAGVAKALQISKITEVAAFASRYLKKRC